MVSAGVIPGLLPYQKVYLDRNSYGKPHITRESDYQKIMNPMKIPFFQGLVNVQIVHITQQTWGYFIFKKWLKGISKILNYWDIYQSLFYQIRFRDIIEMSKKNMLKNYMTKIGEKNLDFMGC